MARILHISKYYYPFMGGTEQVARDCVNALSENEQKVICFNHEKGNQIDTVDDVPVIRVGCFAKVASQSLSMSYGKQLKKVMQDFKPEIIVYHYPNPFVAHYLVKTFKNKNYKLILYWHLDITKQKILGKFFEGQNQKLLEYADKIIATSPNYIDGSPYLTKFKEKCVVIPCCVNTERLKYDNTHELRAKEIKDENLNKTICFAFGRHVEYKGLTYLVKTSKILPDNFIIFIGGEGPLTDSLKMEANNDSKVKFLGKLTNDDLKSYLLACDIFCFPSIAKNEAFGIGLAEAMYFGKPAVTFTIPGSGVNYVNIDRVTGLEVENSNVNQYAKALIDLSSNTELRLKYGLAAKNRIIENFEYESFSKKLIEAIKK